jgi:hypothetical protein
MTSILQRSFMAVSLLGVVVAVSVPQEPPKDISRGKIKKVDAEQNRIVLTVDGTDKEFTSDDKTRFMGGGGNALSDGLRSAELKAGVDVMFKSATRNGKLYLVGLRIAGKGAPGKGLAPRIGDASKLKPLTEMGEANYHGHKGGLYPDRQNERPAAHEAAGRSIAKTIQPLDADGKPSPAGKAVLISVGMSNTTQVFSVFKKLADADADKKPDLIVVDGAQGGMSAARIVNPDEGSGAKYWNEVDRRLKAAGLSRAQVQIAWIKQADAGPKGDFPGYAKTLHEHLAKIIHVLHERFPNLKMVYLSSRTYAGYARSGLNPEPYAWESGLSVRWLIEQQLKGDPALNYDAAKGKVTAPWLSWGPYLWAAGTTKRADGFYYVESDFGPDGTHPAAGGRDKVARELLRFFKTDSTARLWFTARQ